MNIWNFKVFYEKQQIQPSLPDCSSKRNYDNTFISLKQNNEDISSTEKNHNHIINDQIKKTNTYHRKSTYSLNPHLNNFIFSFPEKRNSTSGQRKVN